jgi:murein tripeptide amidase MpaA
LNRHEKEAPKHHELSLRHLFYSMAANSIRRGILSTRPLLTQRQPGILAVPRHFTTTLCSNPYRKKMAQVQISADFDGGNIEHVETVEQDGWTVVRLQILPDVYTELEKRRHMQYFCFRASTTASTEKVRYTLVNAGKVSYPDAWDGTTVFYTTTDYQEVDSWYRNLTTRYVGEELMWEHLHTPDSPTVTFSYFPPYTYRRHCEFMTKCEFVDAGQQVSVLGKTLDGHDLHYVTVGSGPLQAWIIHRQHPGETMAEHYAEGLLKRVLQIDKEDTAAVEQILQDYTLHIVPCMCPDGGVRGHLRTNGVGANLNREWATVHDHYEAPSLQRSPEVYHVWQKMLETGVDFFLDVHGDEELPYNFISGAEHVPTWGPRLEALHGALVASYHRTNLHFQAFIGYPPSPGPKETAKYMNVATNQVGGHFDCVAATLEMPFKDCQSDSEPAVGWTPAKSRQLGASLVGVLQYMQPYLRTDAWSSLPSDDRYIEPTDEYKEFKPLFKRFYSDVREVQGATPLP